MAEDLPTISLQYDKFFTLTERNMRKQEWKIEELTQSELSILNIMLKYIDKTFSDVESITNLVMKCNSFISLLIRFNTGDNDELFVIRRVNNNKFNILIDVEPKQKIIGCINTKYTMYK